MQINQRVAILVDGNNIGLSAKNIFQKNNLMLDFDAVVPKIVGERQLSKFVFFREGKNISEKFAARLQKNFYGIVVPCFKSADSVLTIHAVQMCDKVDTIILFSGDQDYIPLVRFLKSRGLRVEIASLYATTARVLLSESDYHHNLSIEDFFEYQSTFQNRNFEQQSQITNSQSDSDLTEAK